MELLQWVIARGREPSTYAGLGMLLASLHVADASSWGRALTTFGLGFFGVVAMAMKEAGVK